MSEIEIKVNKMDMIHDILGYIMTVGPMLMDPKVSVLTIAAATAGASTTVFKSVTFSDSEEGDYQQEFESESAAAWNYAWTHNRSLIWQLGITKGKSKAPQWTWEKVTSKTSADKTLLMAARDEIRLDLQEASEDAMKDGKLQWDEIWNEDRIARTSDRIARDFFVKLYKLIDNNKVLRPFRDHTLMLKHLETIQGSLTKWEEDHAEFAAEIRELRQIMDVLFRQLCRKDGTGDRLSDVDDIDISLLNSVRKLTEGVWINWKTGCLASTLEAAFSGADLGPESIDLLSIGELRLLSILSQGEGAIVSWEELDTRRKAGEEIQKLIDGHHNRYVGDLVGIRHSEAAKDDDSAAADDEDTEGAYRVIKEVVNVLCSSHPRLKGIIVLEAKGCRILMDAANAVAKDTDSTVESSESASLYDAFYKLHGHSLNDEWKKIIKYRVQKGLPKIPCSEEKEVQTWLRLYYNQVCHSFEGDYSNARGGGDQGADVFGKYKMVQAYINAYATEDEIGAEDYGTEKSSHKVEERIENENPQDAPVFMNNIKNKLMDMLKDLSDDGLDAEDVASKAMLDYIERWYLQGRYGKSKDEKSSSEGLEDIHEDTGFVGNSRILVLHGQPGDGKTTFCKKAVYAHCNEGWLKETPQVLWFSLNVQDNLLTSEDELNLDYALCLIDNKNKYLCDVSSLKGSLIILDGYDELDSELDRHQFDGTDGGAGRFYAFCEMAARYAKDKDLYIVITSRTMCIKDELEIVLDDAIAKVASFAPMTEDQQNALVDRMIELDEAAGRSTEELKVYLADKLPLLRRKKKLRGLFRIPSLFRMIVTTRFYDAGNAQTFTDLLGALFHNLMHYKGTDSKKEEKLISKYEEIASRVFYYGTDVCPFSSEDGMDDERELVYKFLTKQGNGDGGYLGFLHSSFYQYFLARFIVSGIRNLGEAGISAGIGTEKEIDNRQDAEKAEKKFGQFLVILSARRLTETFMWSLVIQLVEAAIRHDKDKRMKGVRAGKGRSSQGNTGIPMPLIGLQHIKMVLALLNREKAVIKSMADGMDNDKPYIRNHEKESDYVVETENAVFNLISACAAAENGCHKAMDEEADHGRWMIVYGGSKGFPNVCRLLRRGNYEDIYLEGLNLDGCDFRDANFRGAYLQGASLVGTDFSGAQLTGAHMRKAKLSGAIMSAADLTAADLREATLTGAKFRYANLRRVRMGGAHMEGIDCYRANLEKSDMRGVVISEENEADLTEANLAKSDLANALLRGVKLVNASIAAAHLEGADLTGADLRLAHLGYSNMADTHMEKVNLQSAFLDGAYMHRANLNGAWLDDASLRSVYLMDAKLEVRSCEGVDFTGAIVTEAQIAHIHGIGKERMPDTLRDRLIKLRKSILEGDKVVIFGHYPQGANNEIMPLRWRVLKVDSSGKEALIITERLIDRMPFNKRDEPVKWSKSYLRGWMNREFLNRAFFEEEKGIIAEKVIPNPGNDFYDTEGCEDTTDRVFALSIDEAEKMFVDDEDRMAAVTPYTDKGGSYVHQIYMLQSGEETGWWLRSPGIHSDFAAFVYTVVYTGGVNNVYTGVVNNLGLPVFFSGTSVRPALWLNLQSEIFKT